MSQWRKDPLLDRWVIVAENRAARPHDFAPMPPAGDSECPFCRGQEAETPLAVATYPSDGDWRVRVVPNKYPALMGERDSDSEPSDKYGLLVSQPALGRHEVIIESPEHRRSLSELTDDELSLTFLAYQDRLLSALDDEALAYALVFKNTGAAGGASLAHVHSQLMATDIVPPDVQREAALAGEYRAMHGDCVHCEMLAFERRVGERIVRETESFVALCPFASRFPCETWILPRQHDTPFHSLAQSTLDELGQLTRDVVRRIELHLGKPAYNYWLRLPPFDPLPHDDFHWRVEVAPRLTGIAGFELGAGCFINPVAPETAARCLRSAC